MLTTIKIAAEKIWIFLKIVKMYVGKLRYGLKFGNHQNLSSL